jgi:hypothetical protein
MPNLTSRQPYLQHEAGSDWMHLYHMNLEHSVSEKRKEANWTGAGAVANRGSYLSNPGKAKTTAKRLAIVLAGGLV